MAGAVGRAMSLLSAAQAAMGEGFVDLETPAALMTLCAQPGVMLLRASPMPTPIARPHDRCSGSRGLCRLHIHTVCTLLLLAARLDWRCCSHAWLPSPLLPPWCLAATVVWLQP